MRVTFKIFAYSCEILIVVWKNKKQTVNSIVNSEKYNK